MPQGDKSKYSDKQIREAEHIAEGYRKRGKSESFSKGVAWATVNKVHQVLLSHSQAQHVLHQTTAFQLQAWSNLSMKQLQTSIIHVPGVHTVTSIRLVGQKTSRAEA